MGRGLPRHPGFPPYSYLDDGMCASSSPAARRFLASLVTGLQLIGLEVNLEKTEVIPPCTSSQSFGPIDFPGCDWKGSASFMLLRALTGLSVWCESLLRMRVAKAKALLDAIGRFCGFLPSSVMLGLVQDLVLVQNRATASP